MENKNNLIFPLEIYSQHLTTINFVKLSKREIDILACILSGKSAKGIADFLSISPKTAETHTYNVMKKLGCTSRESTISLVERSNKFLILKEYYISLLTYIEFEKSLKKISSLISNEKKMCLIVHWQRPDNITSVLHYIKNHLILAGIQTSVEAREKMESTNSLNRDFKLDVYTIYVIPEELSELEKINSFHEINIKKEKLLTNALFISFEKGERGEVFKKLNSIDFTEPENYYFSVFEVLKRLLPNRNLESIVDEFKQRYGLIMGSSKSTLPQEDLKTEKLLSVLLLKERFLKGRRPFFIGLFVTISALSLGFFIIKGVIETDFKPEPNHLASSIRSDLLLPNERVFLDRPELMAKIDNAFKGPKNGIQTIALVGIGGSGKTTLARQYAQQQQASVIWEINAETKGSLIGSFEKLAQALAKTEKDQAILRGLYTIKESAERKEKLILFVKEQLKLQNYWFLVYDNVENCSDIRNYFPKDSKTWGAGKIILTTRNNNIQNSSSIKEVIPIGELSNAQKINLFMQIRGHGENRDLIATQKDIEFLQKIPPFPLDISVAAYYLKTANVPYVQYLKYLSHHDESFTQVQQNLLKEAGEYAKTRYSIITASVKQLVDTNKDFGDLLLFISLLDSQNIPRELINRYKSDIVVDNFIYHLKKYSLIMNESSVPSVGSALSIHRSTQAIALSYLTEMLDLRKNKQLIQSVANVLESYLADIIQKEDFTRMKMITNHCKSFLSQDVLQEGHYLGLNTRIGQIYYLFGNYSKAQKILETNLDILDGQIHIDYPLKAEILSYLGNTHKKLGNHGKAEALLLQNLAIYKQHFPENEMGMAKALTYLGSFYRDQGKYEKAKDFLEQSLALYKTHFPDNPNETARAMVYLGNVYRCLRQPEKSKDLLEQALAIYKKYFPDNHINIAWVLVHLSSPYRDLKEYDKAIRGLEQGIEIYKNHFSENHVEVAWALSHLGHTLRRIGKYERVKDSYAKSLSIYEKSYTKDHLAIGVVLRNLGKTYILEGNMDAAEKVLRQALEIFEKKQHPDTYTCFRWLIELNFKKSTTEENKGNVKQALYFKNEATSYLKKAEEFTQSHFPENQKYLIKVQDEYQKLLNEK